MSIDQFNATALTRMFIFTAHLLRAMGGVIGERLSLKGYYPRQSFNQVTNETVYEANS